MLHGYGNQSFLKKSFEEDREELLEDATNATQATKDWYGISGNQGMGITNPDTYEVKQHPYPMKGDKRKKKKFDVRAIRPEIGDMGDY